MKRPPERQRLRVYQQWQGNERFFCWGHCVTGPSWKSGLGSLVLLIAPTVIFLVFVAPYMADRVSPAILSISCVLPLFCLAMLLLTACRDPGVLPRQEPDEEWLQGRKPRAKDVCVNGQRVTVRYNDTCHFYQPPRAHHCSVNDNCIERFDHHCPWVGTTIGKRNYRTFLLFIYGTSVYIAWTFGVSLGSLFVRHGELVAAQQAAAGGGDSSSNSNLWLQTLSQSGASIALMIFTFIFFWFVCGLSGFHTWLVATNQTTYENFRYNHNQVPNPYSEGCLRNCASVWCRPIPPSKVRFRAFIDEAVKQPVELGFPEWSGGGSNASSAAAPQPLAGSGIGAGGSLRAEPVGLLLPAGAGGGGPEVLELNGGGGAQSGLLGQGGEQATVPIQGYDSVTDGSIELPISRSEGRGEIRAASHLAAAGAAAAAAGTAGAAAGGGGGGWGLPAGRSSPDAVVLTEDAVGIEMASATGSWQQQQQDGTRLAAAGPLVGGAGIQQQQQQGHYGSLAPQQQLMQQPVALQYQHHQQQQQQQQQGHHGNGDVALVGAASGRLTDYEDADGSASETGSGSAAAGGGGGMLLSALSGVDGAADGRGLQR